MRKFKDNEIKYYLYTLLLYCESNTETFCVHTTYCKICQSSYLNNESGVSMNQCSALNGNDQNSVFALYFIKKFAYIATLNRNLKLICLDVESSYRALDTERETDIIKPTNIGAQT